MKEQYHLVSFSGGKDSTAMLLGMLERGMQIDCILFCDTGIEFPAMYDHIAKVEKNIGRKITVVKSEHTFEDLMLNASVNRTPKSSAIREYGPRLNGYGWAGPKMRWCTMKLKNQPRERYLRKLREKYDIIE
jgi:3'-phosphoadenosine 5'-phosphosulfate sulfotransferase (PAPS reductase)/FAD synthetase